MKATGYYARGGTEVLDDTVLPTPAPRPCDLLVAVRAVSVNPVDTKRRRWDAPRAATAPMILG